jgi:hypothetical protein
MLLLQRLEIMPKYVGRPARGDHTINELKPRYIEKFPRSPTATTTRARSARTTGAIGAQTMHSHYWDL